MKFIDKKVAGELNQEAKILGNQIGELMKKVKTGISEAKKSRNS